jgi:cephalosporin-C deacetylase
MPSIDLPLDQLRQYKPPLYRPGDFESFWESTTADALRQPLNAELIPFDLHTKNLVCYAVRFDGYKGTTASPPGAGAAAGRIAGWYVRPEATGKFPGLCLYHGYSGRAPRPLDMLALASQGVCVLSMDCRGQNGQSQDDAIYPEGHQLGWMTQGIRDPRSYYYRYVYADALRALELLAHRDEVDERRLAVSGFSQGGGLALAVAALSNRPALALADAPFLCDYKRAIDIAAAGPYGEIPAFLKSFPHLYEDVIRTLSYVDNLNLAPWITCPCIISACLWDDICPPSTIFGVYHHITAEKRIEVYPFHQHEVPYEHSETKFRAIMETLRP